MNLSDLIKVPGERISIGEAGLYGILGYAVVFLGLIMLMVVIIIVGKIMVARTKKSAAGATASAAPEVPAAPAEKAPGSAGEFALNGVPERDAAMVMAIVADKMGKPLNEIRFISIKEVK